MPDSKRQQIVLAVKTRFQGILIASGYETNIGQKVYEWRDAAIQSADLPALNLIDVAEDSIQGSSNVQEHSLEMWVECHTQDGTTNGATVRKVIADVVKAIGVDRTWGSLAFNTLPMRNEIGFEHKDKFNGGVTIKFKILYRTQNFNPFS